MFVLGRIFMKILKSFTKGELALWLCSVALIALSFAVFGGNGILTLVASIIGVTSLIFNAKGYAFGQFLMIIFSLLYGVISYSFGYYGEMITYLGMTAPMALFALISWLANPYGNDSAEVRVNHLSAVETVLMLIASAVVTFIFCFVLDFFNTANMLFSTLSVTTSFLAVYLTFRRSPYFALAYASNDVILIVLWSMASIENISYVSVVICFVTFLVNDLYGFVSWRKMKHRQATGNSKASPK